MQACYVIITSTCILNFMQDIGADPRAGKGRGTNRLSCRWLGRARFSCHCCIFEAANNHLLVVSHCDFVILAFADGCNCLKGSECLKQQQHDNYF